MLPRARTVSLLAAAARFAAAPGFSSGQPATVKVFGKVMFKKTTPAADALVVFHPLGDEFERRVGGKPLGKVSADGSFTLTTYDPDDGAPEGEYGVTVEWRGKPKEGKMNLGIEGGGSGAAAQSLLNPKYGNPQQPAFKVTVKKGQPNEFTFDVD
jgi:hypothetical protein